MVIGRNVSSNSCVPLYNFVFDRTHIRSPQQHRPSVFQQPICQVSADLWAWRWHGPRTGRWYWELLVTAVTGNHWLRIMGWILLVLLLGDDVHANTPQSNAVHNQVPRNSASNGTHGSWLQETVISRELVLLNKLMTLLDKLTCIIMCRLKRCTAYTLNLYNLSIIINHYQTYKATIVDYH